MEFHTPELRFKFKSGRPAGSKRKIRILPVFQKQKPAELAALFELPELESVLEAHYGVGSYKGAAGQILSLPEHGALLAGLGEPNAFHPETWCALFRSVGEKIARYKDASFELSLSPQVREAVERYAASESQLRDRLKLEVKKKTPARAKRKEAAEPEEGEGEESTNDYASPYNLSELISQTVVSMQSGAEAMEVLKTTAAARKQSAGAGAEKKRAPIEIGVAASLLKGDTLSAALERGQAIAEFLHGYRYISALPGNYLNPETYEEYARKLAREAGLTIRVFQQAQLEKLGAGGILAVGRGSAIPPRMIVVEYKPPKARYARPIALVGKGVTFDTGGISIKPAAEMHEMKFDMCGSALVLHAVALAAKRKLPLHIVGLVGIVENMPDGAAIKPGDVYTALNGLTVEIQNTDAEGRLVLGDVLSYACENYEPLCLMDFATLTGACVIALGHEASGVMTASEDLAGRIDLAGRKSLDRVWRLPHWSVYGPGLKSDIADLRNIAGRPAGTVTAMRFLSRFVDEATPWAHVDIAGTAWRGKASGSQPRGASGWGLRLLNQFFEDLLVEP